MYIFIVKVLKKCMIITKIRIVATTRSGCSQSERMTKELQPNCFNNVLFCKLGNEYIALILDLFVPLKYIMF